MGRRWAEVETRADGEARLCVAGEDSGPRLGGHSGLVIAGFVIWSGPQRLWAWLEAVCNKTVCANVPSAGEGPQMSSHSPRGLSPMRLRSC